MLQHWVYFHASQGYCCSVRFMNSKGCDYITWCVIKFLITLLAWWFCCSSLVSYPWSTYHLCNLIQQFCTILSKKFHRSRYLASKQAVCYHVGKKTDTLSLFLSSLISYFNNRFYTDKDRLCNKLQWLMGKHRQRCCVEVGQCGVIADAAKSMDDK